MPSLLRPRALTLALALLPALALAACDSGGDDAPEVGGTYRATLSFGGASSVYTFDVEDTSGGAFAFDGTIVVTIDGQPETVNVEGTGEYDYPQVTLTAEPEGAGESITFQGTVSDDGDTITTRANGVALVFRRQD